MTTNLQEPLTQTTALTPSLYDTDLFLWAQTNAQLLRERRFSELDIEHIIEEIEDMGKSEFRALESHLLVLMVHLLKWEYQPAYRCGSWRGSIDNARFACAKNIRDNPSFKPRLSTAVREEYPQARKSASYETGLPLTTFPITCTYTMEQILDEEWLPA
jgi:Domain of unknown function DUF29